MGWLNDLLGGLPPVLVYAVVGVLVAAETALVAGLVLPAATALVAMGLLANAGVVPLAPALAVAVTASLLGGNLAFRFGARRALAASTSPKRGRGWDRAERLFAKHGGRAIFLGQWVVGARTLMPRLAARGGVSQRSFLAWHTPAAVLWSLWMVGASYLAGASYDVLAARAGRAAGALAAITLIILGLILAGRWFGRHPDPVRAFARSLPLPAGPWPPRMWHPIARAGLSLGLLTTLAVLLVSAIPAVVRFSGLAATDDAVADWARSQWTSDGYLFALQTATTLVPEALITCAVVVSLARWWWRRAAPSFALSWLDARSQQSSSDARSQQSSSDARSSQSSSSALSEQSRLGVVSGRRRSGGLSRHSWFDAHFEQGPSDVPSGLSRTGVLVRLFRSCVLFLLVRTGVLSLLFRSGMLARLQRSGPRSASAGRPQGRGGWGLLEALGPVLPAVILAAVLAMAVPPGWRAAETLVFPTPAEFDGYVPLDAAALALATMSAGQTAQVAAAAGLLAWLVARSMPWSWKVAVWTTAAVVTVVCAGSWVYLGWSRTSETVAALALGAAWAAVNAAVWSGRADRTRPAPPPAGEPAPAELVLSGAAP